MADIALPGNPISELQDVSCHMGSHSVTFQPMQVMPPPNLSHAGWYSIYLRQKGTILLRRWKFTKNI